MPKIVSRLHQTATPATAKSNEGDSCLKLRIALSTLLAAGMSQACEPGDTFTRFAGFELESGTKLADVQAALGPARVVETGDGGEYEASICYALPDADVTFQSGEIGGGEDLLGVMLSRTDPKRTCTPWPANSPAPTASLGGIGLGIDKQAFAAAVGAPLRWEGKHAYATFASRRPMTAAEIARFPADQREHLAVHPQGAYYDASVTVGGRFVDGRLVELSAWKIETY
jgi:hypothetical protein